MPDEAKRFVSRRVLVASAAFCILFVYTGWLIKDRQSEAPEIAQAPLPAKLNLASADELSIQRPNAEEIVLHKSGEHWSLLKPVAGEANSHSVTIAIEQLQNAEATSLVSSKAENYSKLGVSPDKAVHVVVNGQSKKLADVWIGNYSAGSTVVRFDGDQNVYEMSGTFRYAFDRDLTHWQPKLDPKAPPKPDKAAAEKLGKALRFEK